VKMLSALSSVTTLAEQITTSRYIIVVGYVILLWDSILILPTEIERIWKSPLSVAKLAYLVNHYATIVILTLLTHAFGGLGNTQMSDNSCLGVASIGLAGGVVSLGVGNYLVLLQVWELWSQSPVVRLVLTGGFAVSYSTTLVIACLTIGQLASDVQFVPGLNICGLLHVPTLVRGIWAAPIAFEVLIFCFTVWNAMDRPRPQNSSLARDLYRDGILFFATLSIFRVFNLVIAIVAPTPFIAVGSCLIWEFNTVLLNRLILNQQVPLPEDNDDIYVNIDADDESARSIHIVRQWSRERWDDKGRTSFFMI